MPLARDDMQELYVLQRHFGIGADEALYERHAWELDLLLTGFRAEQKAAGSMTSEPSSEAERPALPDDVRARMRAQADAALQAAR